MTARPTFSPFESAIFPIVYNKDILAAAGWETFPTTYDEMFQMFADIKAAGYNAVGQMAGDNAWTSMLWYSLIVEAIGGKDVYANGLSDPAFVEAAGVLKQMYDYYVRRRCLRDGLRRQRSLPQPRHRPLPQRPVVDRQLLQGRERRPERGLRRCHQPLCMTAARAMRPVS